MNKLAECFKVSGLDDAIQLIQSQRLDPYGCLDKFVSFLIAQALSLNSIITYESTAPGLMTNALVV